MYIYTCHVEKLVIIAITKRATATIIKMIKIMSRAGTT